MRSICLLVALGPLLSSSAAALQAPGERDAQVRALIIRLRHPPEGTFRDEVIRELVKLEATEAVPDLVEALGDEAGSGRPMVAEAAANALDGLEAGEAVPALMRLLRDRSRRVRIYAAMALRRLKPQESMAALVSTLAETVPDQFGFNFESREIIKELVRRGDPEGARALLQVVEAKSDQAPLVAENAAEALATMGLDETEPALLKLLESSSARVRLNAARALIEKRHQEATAELRRLLFPVSGEPGAARLRESAAWVLCKVARPERIPLYLEMLGIREGGIPHYAVKALAELKAKEATALVPLLSEEDVGLRCAALRAIDQIGDAMLARRAAEALSRHSVSPFEAFDLQSTCRPEQEQAQRTSLVAAELKRLAGEAEPSRQGHIRWWLVVLGAAEPTSREAALLAVAEAKAGCDHWGGEEPYDEERQREILEGSERDCAELAEVAFRAYRQHPDYPELSALMLGIIHENNSIPAVKRLLSTPESPRRYCRTAQEYFREEFRSRRLVPEAFHSLCPDEARAVYDR